MSCLNPGYNPPIPRDWNRVQHPCTYDMIGELPTTVYIPALRKYVPYSDAPTIIAMLNKGNILQYKNNSSNLTKNQRYAKIAKGKWTNRTSTWATQSDKYTQPNIRLFKRANVINNIYLNGTPTLNPITCDPNTPQEEIVIENGGVLLCTVQYNPCTGETIVAQPKELCYPTSSSDVPGPIMNLCYNDSMPTYYPRKQYVMNSSGDKWPQGYKGFVSANETPSL